MLIKYPWDIKEEEKEEIEPGWKQRTRGIGVLPTTEVEEEKPKVSVISYPWEVKVGIGAKAVGEATLAKPEDEIPPLIEGLPISRPEDKPFSMEGWPISKPEGVVSKIGKGLVGVFGTWEAKKRAMPELQEVEDFGSKVISEAVPLAQSRYGEEYNKRGSYKEEIAIIHEYLTGAPRSETLKEMDANFREYGNINPDVDERTWLEYFRQEGLWKTLITGPTKGIYDEAEKLQRQLSDIRMRVAEPGKDLIGQIGWVGMVAILGYQAVAGAIKVSPIIINKIKNKQIVKHIPQDKAFKAILEVTKGTDTSAQRKLFDNILTDAQAQGISVGKVIRGGYTYTGVTPRFAFGTKLYAGLPADEIVKSLVSTGKVTADIARELSLAKPELVSQVIQNLSIASPAIASKLAPELAKLIPEEVVKPPKVEVKKPEDLDFLRKRLPFLKELLSEKTIQDVERIKKEIKSIEEILLKADVKPLIPPSIPEVPIAKKVIEKPEKIPKVEPKVPTIPEELKIGNKVKFKKFYADIAEGQEAEITKKYTTPKGETLLNLYFGENLTGQKITRKGVPLNIIEISKVEPKPPPTIEPTPTPEPKPIEPTPAPGVPKVIPKEITKVIEIKKETQKSYDRLIDERVSELKEEGFKSVDRGGLKRTEEGEVIGVIPTISKNPKWYRDFYSEHKKAPDLTDLKEIAKEQLAKGHTEDYGEIPANDTFVKIEAQLESYDTIIDTLREGKELTPKIINKIKSGKLPIEISKLLTAEEKYPERFAKEEIKEFKKFITEEEEEFIKVEREYPAKIIKEEIEELQPLATPAQIKKAHAIADSKAMTSDAGKVKPQYRKIAEAFTDQKSIKKMTTEEAEVFIDALNRLPEPKMKAGKLVPPSIPRTMKLVTEDFFKRKYGEPTPIWLLTDQTYYATKLGIKPLVEPFERGKQEFDLEFRLSSNLVDRMVNKLNTIAKTSVWARARSRVKNIPTKAESDMAGLLNKHEATPPGLTEKEEDVFKYFRNLSKDIWRRENEVREKVDLPPIKYKTAYFRHVADAMAKEMLEGKYPFPQGIKYWAEKMVGKKIFNPMEFQRKLSDDLIDIWSKDIRAVTKAMLWNGLKEIYLAQPAKFLNEQLNAITKDLPEYKNLSPRDQATYDQTRVMPASTRKWLVDYVNQVLKGQETELDASLNRIVTKSGLKGIFDKVLSPFGRSIGRKPITNLFMLSGRAVISGVMGWVPRQIIRNAFQQVQNLALYGVKATAKSFLPASIDKNLKGLLNESLFLRSYTGFEELPVNLMGKLEKVWLKPYGIVAVNNAKQGMKAAYWDTLELIKNPKYKKHGWSDPKRTKDTPKGFLYPKEEEYLSREMEFGSSATQYQYIPIGMPGIFRYKAFVPLTRLQSWWMNYFTKFNREAIHRGLKWRPSWAGEDGPTLPWSRRVNWLKYLIIGGAVLTALGYKRSFMLGVAPTYLSPAGQVALGFYNYVTADADWKKEKALKQIYYSWKAFIPGSLAWRDFLAVWKGEKDLEEILFYGKKKEKPSKAVPTKPQYEWEKTKTEKKSIIKYDWD